MRAVHVGRRVPGAGVAADLGPDQPVDGEERELRDGGDGTAPAVRRDEVGHALRAVGGAYRLQGEPGDSRPERVPDGPAEQGPPYPAAEVLLLGAAPDGCGPCGHRAPFFSPTHSATAQAL